MKDEKTWRLIDTEFVKDRKQSQRVGYDVYRPGYLVTVRKNGKEVWSLKEERAKLLDYERARRALAWWKSKHGGKDTVTVG